MGGVSLSLSLSLSLTGDHLVESQGLCHSPQDQDEDDIFNVGVFQGVIPSLLLFAKYKPDPFTLLPTSDSLRIVGSLRGDVQLSPNHERNENCSATAPSDGGKIGCVHYKCIFPMLESPNYN